MVAGDTPRPIPNLEVKPGHVARSTELPKGSGNVQAAKLHYFISQYSVGNVYH